MKKMSRCVVLLWAAVATIPEILYWRGWSIGKGIPEGWLGSSRGYDFLIGPIAVLAVLGMLTSDRIWQHVEQEKERKEITGTMKVTFSIVAVVGLIGGCLTRSHLWLGLIVALIPPALAGGNVCLKDFRGADLARNMCGGAAVLAGIIVGVGIAEGFVAGASIMLLALLVMGLIAGTTIAVRALNEGLDTLFARGSQTQQTPQSSYFQQFRQQPPVQPVTSQPQADPDQAAIVHNPANVFGRPAGVVGKYGGQ